MPQAPFTAAIIGAYALLGLLVARSSIAPGIAMPLDAASGIAVGCVVLWRQRALPGVLLGALLLPFLLDPLAGTDAMPLIARAPFWLLGAIGSAGCAWLTAHLVIRWVPYPGTIDTPHAIAKLMLLAAPIGGAVAGILGSLGHWLTAPAERGELLFRVVHLGIGHALGTAIVLPIMLALFGQPRADWRARRLAIVAPLMIALIVVGAAIGQIARLEHARIQAAVDREAQLVMGAAAERINGHLSVLDATHAFISAARHVDIERFSTFAQHWFPRFGGIGAIGLSTRVQANERDTFEATIRAQSPLDFQILTRDRDGRLTPAAAADEHFAITYIEPRHDNLRALGVDQLSIPEAREAITRAVNTGTPAASRAFRLTQDHSTQTGIVIYRPFYRSGPEPMPMQRDRWYVAGMSFVALRPDHLLQALDAQVATRTLQCLMDVSDPVPVRLAGIPGCELTSPGNPVRSQKDFKVADRQWRMTLSPRPGVNPTDPYWTVGGIAVSALLSVALFAAFLLVVSGRARRTEALISARTQELEREITERRIALLAKTESETRLRDMFDIAPVGISYLSLDGTLQRINPRFSEITGRDNRDIDGRKIVSLLDERDRDEFAIGLLGLISAGTGIYRQEARCLRPDGSTVHVELLASLHRNAAGEPRQVVVAMQDITARLELVTAQRAREAAEAASSAKTQFLSRISHELRTPLNALLGFAQLLRMDVRQPLDTRQAEHVRHIEQAGWHLLNMINDVLDLSRIESGSVRIELQDIDLDPLLEECRRLLRAHYAQHSVSLSITIAPEARHVRGDPTRMRQVLTNLLDNAAKYNRPQGRVFVNTRRDETGAVVISVRDEGMGMSREQRSHLFEPFNRLGREQATAGTGIGLVITRHLVEMMGGTIAIDSVEGKGSLFTVTLARAHPGPSGEAGTGPETDAPHPSPITPEAAGSLSGTIVYVEDNRLNAMLVQDMLLQHTRLVPEIFEDAEEALPRIAALQPLAVLMDLNLPGMDGLQALARLRMDPTTASVPVVIVSADALAERIEQAHELGADGYLTKPLRLAELIGLLERVIGRPRSAAPSDRPPPTLRRDEAPTTPADIPPH